VSGLATRPTRSSPLASQYRLQVDDGHPADGFEIPYQHTRSSMAAIWTQYSPIGLGRSWDRVLNTPHLGLDHSLSASIIPATVAASRL
jgi:hypothetical protein